MPSFKVSVPEDVTGRHEMQAGRYGVDTWKQAGQTGRENKHPTDCYTSGFNIKAASAMMLIPNLHTGLMCAWTPGISC